MDIAHGALDGVSVWDWPRNGVVQVAEGAKAGLVVEGVEQIAESRDVAANIVLCRGNGVETGLSGRVRWD